MTRQKTPYWLNWTLLAILIFALPGFSTGKNLYVTKVPLAKSKQSGNKIVEVKTDISFLKNKIICIDPGHQGKPDAGKEPLAPFSHILKEKVASGTSGIATGIPEYKLNLEVALKLRDLLLKYGAKVIMTREVNNVQISNVERAKFANNALSDMVVRLHADGSRYSSAKGISVLVPGKKYISDSSILSHSRLAAAYALNAVTKITGAASRGIVERDDLSGFNWTKVPAFLIEMGFMTNPDEDRLLNNGEYQQRIVIGIVQGLASYFKNVV
jgi:N-acetylmuramoyl-L-alanine amidase